MAVFPEWRCPLNGGVPRPLNGGVPKDRLHYSSYQSELFLDIFNCNCKFFTI